MSSGEKAVLVKMIHTLLRDLQTIEQRGAGYYTVEPFIDRYNKLLEQTIRICPNQKALLDTFDIIEHPKSSDPSQKMKASQRVAIEIGQLLALIEASDQGEDNTPEPPEGD